MSKGRARTPGLLTTTPCQLSKILQRKKKRHRVSLVLVVVVRVGRVRARLRIPLSCGAAQEEVVIVLDRPRWVLSGQSAPMRFLPSVFLLSDAWEKEEQRLCVRL